MILRVPQQCVGRIGAATVCVSMLLIPVASPAVEAPKPADLDSPGAIALRKLSKDVINAPKPKRFSLEAQRQQELATPSGPEEIIVRADREPDDVISKRARMEAFRDKLERDRPMTPKEKVQVALCFIGVCGAQYGPEGIPVENTSSTRGEKGAKKSSLELSQQFRGTFQ